LSGKVIPAGSGAYTKVKERKRNAPPFQAVSMLRGREGKGIFGAVPHTVKWLVLLMLPSYLATGYFWVATSAYLPQIGISAENVGLILSINGVAFMVAAIPMGLMADRTGRKRILMAGVLGMPPCLFIYGLTSDLTFLLAASAVAGIAEGAFLTTWNAMIADLATGEGRREAFALSFIVSSVAMGLGYALPYVFPTISNLSGMDTFQVHQMFFFLMAAVALITPFTLAQLLKDYKETPTEGVVLKRGKNFGPMMKFSVSHSMIGLGAGFIIPLIPLWLLDKFNIPDTFSGPLLAVAMLTIGFASIASAGLALRYGMVKAIVICQGSSTIFMLALAFIPDPAVVGLFIIIRAALMNMSGPLTDSFLMGIISKEERGLASAINSIVWRLPNSVTTVVGGILLGMGMYEAPFILATLFYVIADSMFYYYFRDVELANEDQ
jgi:MFS family permease